ncbi:MAG: cyanophycinase [Pseudomonadota bacterium]
MLQTLPKQRNQPVRKLAIIGGRLEDDNRDIYREMRRLCEGRILIFPTASSEPYEVGEETREAFQIHGFECDVAHLSSENANEAAFDPKLIEQVQAYGSVYFTGGDQANIYQALVQNGVETPLLTGIREALALGGLLAGSSAGAAIMSDSMIMGGTSFEAIAAGVTENPEMPGLLLGKGLGFFERGLVDQHFIKRGRLARLVVALASAEQRCGFGIDENTALFVEGALARVIGEYGVFFVDMKDANVDLEASTFENIRIDYLDDGDAMNLDKFTTKTSESKRRVKKDDIAYRAPAKSPRNAFGAYALYDLVARLVLGDLKTYNKDDLVAIDPKSRVATSVALERVKRKSRCYVSTPSSGMRISAVNLMASMKREILDADTIEARLGRGTRTLGLNIAGQSRIILLGSSPVYYQPEKQKELLEHVEGPVGVIGAASFEARRAAADHVAFFKQHDLEAEDLAITHDTIDYTSKNAECLRKIEASKTLFLCGGNQIRLVNTLLHRGEESAVLRSVAKAYANGALIMAASGAASAMSDVMISGGTTGEALRYGVASDLSHLGLVVQQGLGIFPAGIVDQNMLTAKRLGRLVVACGEENERFGFGICEDSAVVTSNFCNELTAIGQHGFVQVETDPVKIAPTEDRFIVKGIKLKMIGSGDTVSLHTDHIERRCNIANATLAFDRLTEDLMREGIDIDRFDGIGRDPSLRHAIGVRLRRTDPLTAVLDLECAREEHDT